MADRAATQRQEARHAGGDGAVHDLRQGQLHRRARSRAPGHPLAGMGIPRPGGRAPPRASHPRVRRAGHDAVRLGVLFMYYVVLPTGARLPHVVRRQHLRHPDPGELLLQLRRADAARRGASRS